MRQRQSTPFFLAWILSLVLQTGSSAQAETPEFSKLNLKQCVARALQYNDELRVKDLDIALAHEKLEEVKSVGYPIFEYEYNLAPVPTDLNNAVESLFQGDVSVFNRFKLGVGTPLTTFGKISTGKSLARTGIKAEREKKAQKSSDLIYKINQLYYGVLLADEVNRLLETAGEKLQKEIDKREEESGYDPSELLKMKLLSYEIDKKIEEALKKRELALGALKGLLGYENHVVLELRDEKLRPIDYNLRNFEDYLKGEFSNRPEVKLLDIGVEAREKQLSLEESKRWPNLAVGAFFEIGHAPNITGVIASDDFNDPFNYKRAGLGLQLKGSFDFHKQFSKEAQSRSELKKMEIQRDLGLMGLKLDLKEAYLDVTSAKASIERADGAGKLSRQLLFLTQSNFDLGLSESKDLVDAVQSFLTTRGEYFEAVYNYNVACAKFDMKLGRTP